MTSRGVPAWPDTVEVALARLIERLGPEWKADIRSRTREGMRGLHFTLGLWIRNELGLWRGNDALLADCARRDPSDSRLADADRASRILLEALWDRLHEGDAGAGSAPESES